MEQLHGQLAEFGSDDDAKAAEEDRTRVCSCHRLLWGEDTGFFQTLL